MRRFPLDLALPTSIIVLPSLRIFIMTVPTVEGTPCIELRSLAARSESMIQQMMDLLEAPGFFFLDLRSVDECEDIVKFENSVYQAAKDYFKQSRQTKLNDARKDISPSSDRGYVSDRPANPTALTYPC